MSCGPAGCGRTLADTSEPERADLFHLFLQEIIRCQNLRPERRTAWPSGAAYAVPIMPMWQFKRRHNEPVPSMCPPLSQRRLRKQNLL